MSLHRFHLGSLVARSRRTIALGLVAVCLVGLAAPHAAAEAPNREKLSQIKAAFVLNFIRLTKWPADSFPQASSPFVVSIVGGEDLVPYLDQTLDDQSAQGHPIVLRRHTLPRMDDAEERHEAEAELAEELQRSHLVVLGPPDSDAAGRLLAALAGRPILTVGDGGDYIDRGAMLALQLEGDRMIFFASRDALGRSKVEVDANLLRLARLKSQDRGKH